MTDTRTRDQITAHARTCACRSCTPMPIWPSNSVSETLHRHQILFDPSDHNHSEVLGEKTYSLPLLGASTVNELSPTPTATYCLPYSCRPSTSFSLASHPLLQQSPFSNGTSPNGDGTYGNKDRKVCKSGNVCQDARVCQDKRACQQGPFVEPPLVINEATGKVQRVPWSTDNQMHLDWVQTRLQTNVNTPIGSDSNIYFGPGSDIFYQGTPAENGYGKWKDWLDRVNEQGAPRGTVADAKVKEMCIASKKSDRKAGTQEKAGSQDGNTGLICSQTCVDWWTQRNVAPQGSLQSSNALVSGGCPFGTLPALSCYSCNTHTTYQNGQNTQFP